MDFTTMMTLEPHGPDTFVGIGPKYPWGGLYGGQIVAQALGAACATVEPQFRVHSLHAYFIRRGDHEEPIRFEVDRIRNGRSFATRSVVARQSIGAILNMSASFQIDESAPDMQIAEAPQAPRPDELKGIPWMQMFERRFAGGDSGRAIAWLRMIDEVGDDPVLNACALAYVSDDLPTDAVVKLLYPERKIGEWDTEFPFWTASLDHAIWFHRPIKADEWQLQDFTCHGIMSSRGLSLGHVFDAEGVHLATISQEVLLRDLR
jgi:acyl-CoA thioesterase-2